MSIATAIENLSGRIQDAYAALLAKGATMPADKNSYNLSSTIDTVVELKAQDMGMVYADRSTDSITGSPNTKTYTKTIVPDSEYNGISSIQFAYKTIVNKNIIPSTSDQVFERPLSGGNVGYEKISVSAVNSSIDSNIQAGNIKNGVTILGVTGTMQGAKTEESKTVTPTAAGFTVTPNSGNVLTSVVINGDADLIAGNIKKDVQIFGVTGSYEGSGGGGGLQGYTLTVTGSGSGSISFTAYHPDGTSESVHVGNGTSLTVNNVAYINIHIGGSGSSDPYFNGNHNILLLSDTTLNFTFPCILRGTPVNLWSGQTKRIEDITYDDEILCWDFDNGKYASAKPFWIKKTQHNTIYWLNKFQSGKEIKTTGTVAGHRFFDIDKGKFLYNTECVGDLCYTKDGPDRLIETKYVEGECEFYNIYTKFHMNLFANGILTGFRYNNLYQIKDMKFVKDGRVQRSREEFKQIPDSWFYGMRCAEQTDSAEEIASYALSREIIKK